MPAERLTESVPQQAGSSDQHSGVWGSVAREINLGGAAISGIGSAFADLKDHPGTALMEFGGAALIAGGLTLAGRGGPFLSTGARIVQTGLAISFAKQLLTSGTEFGGAVVDAWQSPQNLQRDKDTVGRTAGQFAVDMAVFSAGGYAGSRLAGKFMPGAFSTSALDVKALHNGPVRFAPDSVAVSRETVPQDALGIRSNLETLLGTTEINQRFSSLTVPTRYGNATLSPYYSKESNALSLFVDAPRSLTRPHLEVSLDQEGLPTRMVVHNDQAQFIPSLFQEIGLPKLAAATGTPTEFALSDKFGAVNYADVNAKMTQGKLESGAPISISESYKGSDAIYVRQKMGDSAPISTALGTADMGPCSALIIIDRASGRHFLAHVDHVSNPDLLRQSFKSFDLNKSDIYILEGPDSAASSSDALLGSAQRAFMAVSQSPGAASRVKFLHYAADTRNAQVVIKDGKIYAGAATYVGL